MAKQKTPPLTFKVYLCSLGCPKNRVDSEVILAALQRLPTTVWEITPDPSSADIILVNTCAFIDAAQEESINTILELSTAKHPTASAASSSPPFLVVTGCLEQRYPQELPQLLPEVDLFLPASHQPFINNYFSVQNKRLHFNPHPGLPAAPAAEKLPYYARTALPRHLTTLPGTAWLKIAEGCNRRCTFCAIPHFKGRYVSRKMQVLLQEAQDLVKQGVQEINLVAQDLSGYGRDLGLKNGLIHLVQKLAQIKDLKWIRLLYIYPEGITPELIKLLQNTPKVCPYLDIPIQHLSPKILKAMGRRISPAAIKQRIAQLRKAIPQISLRTSILVGFPGEDEQDLAVLQQGLTELQFDHLGVFAYSPQAGTTAAELPGQIPLKEKNRRQKLIYKLQKKIITARLKKLKGTTTTAILEGPHPETDLLVQARLITQAPDVDEKVMITELQQPHQVGDIIRVTITQVKGMEIAAQETTWS
jgi:ribosomal protein S12 methylthiotransferase